jgi:prepilin-type N-terminal cleavage/methylation domain-containing protein/prepilin-type processing-associated H-X9-DG protein
VPRAPAFTLVELLVVLGIIAVLLALLLPVLRKVRGDARLLACKAQIHGVLLAHANYAVANRYVKPPLLLRKAISVRYDWVSPDVRWTGQPVGQGILVAAGYLTLDSLLDPSLEMAEDTERDRAAWSNLLDSGSSYAYFWQRPPAAGPVENALAAVTYTRAAAGGRQALLMDLNAQAGHQYLGEYQGRQWVAHGVSRRVNVGYVDGSVRDFALDEVVLKFPGAAADERVGCGAAPGRGR